MAFPNGCWHMIIVKQKKFTEENVYKCYSISEVFIHIAYSWKCIFIKPNFYNIGPVADRIEQDFDRLLNGREISRPSLEIPGVSNPPTRKTKLPYRTCSNRRPSSQLTNSLGLGNFK